MAHKSSLIGGASESLAKAIFMANGFTVFEPVVPEPYDIIVFTQSHNSKKISFSIQIKTIKWRKDGDYESRMVIRGAPNSGIPYSKDDVDYILGIDLQSAKGYLIPNNEQLEYTAINTEVAKSKWTELTL